MNGGTGSALRALGCSKKTMCQRGNSSTSRSAGGTDTQCQELRLLRPAATLWPILARKSRFNLRMVEERMMKKQHYMTNDERQKLEALYNAGMPVTRIARELGFCRQTIYNEIRTGLYQHEKDFGPVWRYSADKAQQKHAYTQTAKGRPLKIDHNHDLASYLESKIVKEKYSPSAALAAARKDGFTDTICVNTLYSYIDKQIFLHLTNKDLWIKAKKKKHSQPVQRIAHPLLPSITDRPDYINKRQV